MAQKYQKVLEEISNNYRIKIKEAKMISEIEENILQKNVDLEDLEEEFDF